MRFSGLGNIPKSIRLNTKSLMLGFSCILIPSPTYHPRQTHSGHCCLGSLSCLPTVLLSCKGVLNNSSNIVCKGMLSLQLRFNATTPLLFLLQIILDVHLRKKLALPYFFPFLCLHWSIPQSGCRKGSVLPPSLHMCACAHTHAHFVSLCL